MSVGERLQAIAGGALLGSIVVHYIISNEIGSFVGAGLGALIIFCTID